VLRTNRFAVLFRHLNTFDAALPDVVDDAIVNGKSLNVGFGVDFESVVLGVLDGQVGNRNTRASGDADEFSVAAPGTVDDYTLTMS
jgi:hypothetical protein